MLFSANCCTVLNVKNKQIHENMDVVGCQPVNLQVNGENIQWNSSTSDDGHNNQWKQ